MFRSSIWSLTRSMVTVSFMPYVTIQIFAVVTCAIKGTSQCYSLYGKGCSCEIRRYANKTICLVRYIDVSTILLEQISSQMGHVKAKLLCIHTAYMLFTAMVQSLQCTHLPRVVILLLQVHYWVRVHLDCKHIIVQLSKLERFPVKKPGRKLGNWSATCVVLMNFVILKCEIQCPSLCRMHAHPL